MILQPKLKACTGTYKRCRTPAADAWLGHFAYTLKAKHNCQHLVCWFRLQQDLFSTFASYLIAYFVMILQPKLKTCTYKRSRTPATDSWLGHFAYTLKAKHNCQHLVCWFRLQQDLFSTFASYLITYFVMILQPKLKSYTYKRSRTPAVDVWLGRFVWFITLTQTPCCQHLVCWFRFVLERFVFNFCILYRIVYCIILFTHQ